MWPHEKFFYSITLHITKLLILNYPAYNSPEAHVGFSLHSACNITPKSNIDAHSYIYFYKSENLSYVRH